MPLDPKKKEKIIEKFKTHATDTGSPEVQIAILTSEIKQLTDHLKTHRKDFSSRRGLLKKVGQRRRLLTYLAKENRSSYEKLADKLKLKTVISQPEAEPPRSLISHSQGIAGSRPSRAGEPKPAAEVKKT